LKLFVKNVGDAPYTHAVALAMVANAINLVVEVGPSPLGKGLVLLVAIAAGLGGLMIFLGLQWRGSLYMSYGIERVGQSLAFCAWLIDLVLIYILAGWTWGLSTPFLLAGASAIRFFKLRGKQQEIENTVNAAVERHRRVGD
jgi:hypothetical protein